jgi:signal transduction histidine kinase
MTGSLVLAAIAATALMVFWHLLETRLPLPLPSREPPAAAPMMYAEPRTDADLVQLLSAMPGDCAALLQRGGIALQQQLACGALPVFVQQTGIRQLLANVVTIATHAMEPGGTLKVLARAEGAQAVVHFVDAGAEGEHAALARLFERAVTGPREAAAGSVGACAASCQRLATEHGGRVYPAPAPSGELGLTLRLPLCALTADEEIA